MLNKTIISLFKILTALLFVGNTLAFAAELNEPQLVVKNATDTMINALNENKTELEANPDKIYGMVEEILLPHFDFEKMTKLAMGKNWKKADATQRTKLVNEFKLLLVRTYSTALLEYQGQDLKMLPFRGDLSRKRASVPTEIVLPNGTGISMALSLYENKQSQEWKVYDIKIEGISLVSNYRSDFSDRIRAEGVDGLIAYLSDKNAKLKS